jgi:exopolysaccharide biosynthesis protein
MKPIRLAVALLFVASAALAAEEWTAVAPGLDYREFTGAHSDVHVARIDLTNDALMVIGTPQAHRGTTVSDYAKKNKALVAINADYFDAKFNPIGLTIGPCGQWEGSKDTGREGVVAVGKGRALIQKQSEVMDPVDEWVGAAVGGWPMLVKECTPLTAKELPGSDAFTRAPHPRTAVGLTKDGKTMYFVVAEGRRSGIPGMTLAELAEFMEEELGACSAINLDGGGSTAMWVGDKIVNRPSDGVERRVGDHLAVVLAADFPGCPPAPPATQISSTTTAPATAPATTATTPQSTPQTTTQSTTTTAPPR